MLLKVLSLKVTHFSDQVQKDCGGIGFVAKIPMKLGIFLGGTSLFFFG